MTHFVVPTGNNTISALMLTANSYAEGMFGLGILIAIFIISFFALKTFDTERAFAASSFFTMIVAILLRLLGIIAGYVMWLAIIIGILGFATIYITQARRRLG